MGLSTDITKAHSARNELLLYFKSSKLLQLEIDPFNDKIMKEYLPTDSANFLVLPEP